MSAALEAVHLNGQTLRITLDGARIGAITPVAGPAQAVILPLPVDPHVHLDKTHVIDRCPPAAPGLFGAIAAIMADVPNWTADDLRARAERGMREAWANGFRAIRTHVDWPAAQAPLSWSVLGEVAQDWAGRITLQRAALTALDTLGDPAIGPQIAAEVARTGGVLGCFIYRNDDLAAKLARVFDLARAHDLWLDFHVDEGLDTEATGFDAIVAQTARHGMGGRVLCGHACSLGTRPEADVARVMAQAAQAGVALTILPTSNGWLQDNSPGRSPRLRGMAPMQELRAAGVAVLLGADNVRDPFYPYGSYDALDIYRQAVLGQHLAPADWLDTITAAPARALGLPKARIAPGEAADFLLIAVPDWAEAISLPRAARQVFRAGALQPER